MFALPIFPGERRERRRWREERPERVAAVEKIEDRRKPDDFFGHRNGDPPSIVGVHVLNFCVRDGHELARRQWRMQGQAQCGQRSAGSEPASSGDAYAGHRNRKQVDCPSCSHLGIRKTPVY